MFAQAYLLSEVAELRGTQLTVPASLQQVRQLGPADEYKADRLDLPRGSRHLPERKVGPNLLVGDGSPGRRLEASDRTT
jgi:hypothetical protein